MLVKGQYKTHKGWSFILEYVASVIDLLVVYHGKVIALMLAVSGSLSGKPLLQLQIS